MTTTAKVIQKAKSPKSARPVATGGESMRTRLLLSVCGSAFVGLGALAFFLYQELLTSARGEIEQAVVAQSLQLEAKLTSARQATDALAGSAQVLYQIEARSPQAYEQMVRTGFRDLDFVVGMGIYQNGVGLVSNGTGFSAYFVRDKGQNGAKVSKVTQQGFAEAPFFVEAVTGTALWLEPSRREAEQKPEIVTTYSAPIVNPSQPQRVLGVAKVEIATDQLTRQLSRGVIANQAGYFAVVSDRGKLLSFPPDPARVLVDVNDVPELRSIWLDSATRNSAISQGGGNFLAFRKVAGTNWRVIGVVPEAVVRDRVLVTTLLTVAGVAILLGIAVFWFVNYLNRRLKQILEECDRLTQERGGAEQSLMGGDELDRLEASFHSMVKQIAQNEERIKAEVAKTVQSQERQKIAQELQQEQEASELEVSILLEVVSSLEEGDLTIEAEVSDRATGLVADTLNRLRERLAETIARVLATAQQVAMGAEELQILARTVASNTVDQAQSVSQGRALTEQVALSAKNSTDQVKAANQALQEVQMTVEEAQFAITKLTEGIAVLQKGSAQIIQRMKTLGEFVGLAEQFVQDQSQIAALTQVLAINATLVAARAAEQRDPKQFIGVAREFEAIADQVNTLATQTNQGLTALRQRTGQIQAVVSAVDTEVQGLGGLVAGFTSGVEQSATAFKSVRHITQQVVSVGQSITGASLEIATASDSTAKYMSEIATLADQTADLTANARKQAEIMGSIAQELLTGIRFFRLPENILPDSQTPESESTTVDIDSAEILANDLDFEDFDDYEEDYAVADQSLSIPDDSLEIATLAQIGDDIPDTFAQVLDDPDLMAMDMSDEDIELLDTQESSSFSQVLDDPKLLEADDQADDQADDAEFDQADFILDEMEFDQAVESSLDFDQLADLENANDLEDELAGFVIVQSPQPTEEPEATFAYEDTGEEEFDIPTQFLVVKQDLSAEVSLATFSNMPTDIPTDIPTETVGERLLELPKEISSEMTATPIPTTISESEQAAEIQAQELDVWMTPDSTDEMSQDFAALVASFAEEEQDDSPNVPDLDNLDLAIVAPTADLADQLEDDLAEFMPVLDETFADEDNGTIFSLDFDLIEDKS